MKITGNLLILSIFITISSGSYRGGFPYLLQESAKEAAYHILEFNNLLMEMQHCSISLTIHPTPGFKIQLDPIKVPISLYSTNIGLHFKHPVEYSPEFEGKNNRMCRVIMFASLEPEYLLPLAYYTSDRTGKLFPTRGFVMRGPNPSWPCIRLPAYVIFIPLSYQTPKRELSQTNFFHGAYYKTKLECPILESEGYTIRF